MNVQPSNRRQDLPVRLGTHGYRLDGDDAVLNAELHIPPYFSGSDLGLELWACPGPHTDGAPRGVKVAEIALELPTPIGPHIHRVEARAAATTPPGNDDHAMVLMLVSNADGVPRVHDFANYGRLQHFSNPQLEGAVAYAISGAEVTLSARSVANPRPEGNNSGTLCLELWACAEPYAGGAVRGHRLAVTELGSVFGQYQLPNVERRTSFTPPPPGRWHVALLLREWTVARGYATRDYRNFELVHEQAAPERATPERTAVERDVPERAAAALLPRATDKLRLIRPAEATLAGVTTEAAAPAAMTHGALAEHSSDVPVPAPSSAGATLTAEARGLSNVNTATLEELAKLPGSSLKVAKEIIKGRPFPSLDALINVRGIGEKTLRKIKAFLLRA
jgi:DNA uptake protein ComE-like DNA-binding protein